MASISVPCPKCSLIALRCGSRQQNPQQQAMVSISAAASSTPRPSLLARTSRLLRLQGTNQNQCTLLKAQANEVTVESSSNSAPKSASKLETQLLGGKDAELVKETTPQATDSESTISTFMTEVSNLIKLVDSRDIMELQLKRMDSEIIIRKKEALLQPPAPVVMMQAPSPQAMLPPPPLPDAATPSAPAAPASLAPAPALPPPAKTSKSSLPPLKCPMAGTFYRCSAPGEPPFVKVGDRVQKGQVVCIIEAMKLMNEIEADLSGTIVEIVAEDGKTVSVDTPLLIIQP